jgi:hypothetical protein
MSSTCCSAAVSALVICPTSCKYRHYRLGRLLVTQGNAVVCIVGSAILQVCRVFSTGIHITLRTLTSSAQRSATASENCQPTDGRAAANRLSRSAGKRASGPPWSSHLVPVVQMRLSTRAASVIAHCARCANSVRESACWGQPARHSWQQVHLKFSRLLGSRSVCRTVPADVTRGRRAGVMSS